MKILDSMAEAFSELLDGLNKVYQDRQADVARAQAQGNSSAISEAISKYDTAILVLKNACLEKVKAIAQEAKAKAVARVTAPLDQETATQLEFLKSRDTIGKAELDALIERYGRKYQAMAVLAGFADTDDPLNMHGKNLSRGAEFELLCEQLNNCISYMEHRIDAADPERSKNSSMGDFQGDIIIRGGHDCFSIADLCLAEIEQYSL